MDEIPVMEEISADNNAKLRVLDRALTLLRLFAGIATKGNLRREAQSAMRRQRPTLFNRPALYPFESKSMTFCVGIKVTQGLVALADTQIVKGDERLSKGKLTLIKFAHSGFSS